MSTALSPPRTPKDKSHRKHKDRSEKKSSKKRRREEQDDAAPETSQIVIPETPQASTSSPTKKRRTTERQSSPTIASSSRASALIRRANSGTTKNAIPSIYVQAASLYLPLSPVCQNYPLEGLCAEHLSPLILTYYAPVKGVILFYSNVRLSEHSDAADSGEPALATSINEYGANFVWVTADFTVFRPRRGVELEGWVNLQNESHLGLIVWNLFSASVERKRLPSDWTWVEDSGNNEDAMEVDGEEEAHSRSKAQRSGEGYFVDADGSKIGGMIKFRVKDFDVPPANESERAFISIEGMLLGEDEERRLVGEEAQKRSGKRRTNGVAVATTAAPAPAPTPVRPRPTLKATSSKDGAEEQVTVGAEKVKKSKKKRAAKA